jgi:hypothetical protein
MVGGLSLSPIFGQAVIQVCIACESSGTGKVLEEEYRKTKHRDLFF